MNKVLRYEVPEEIALDASTAAVLTRHLHNSNATVFEVYDSFLLISFEWFNLKSKSKKEKKISLFLDRQQLLVFMEDAHLCTQYRSLFETEKEKSCQEMLRMFFIQLIEHDMEYIDEFEEMITNAEDHALQEKRKDYLNQIIKFRKQLLHLKHYYNQLQVIFDGLLENENRFFDEETLRRLNIIHNRIDRLQLSVTNLRDYVTQMREAYQAQIDIEQNNIMKLFTLITAIFLPLTLMVGWYGMNFKYMYELDSIYGYPVFIVVSFIVCVLLILYFKKKRWF